PAANSAVRRICPAHGLVRLRFDSARWLKTNSMVRRREKSRTRFGAARPARKRNLKVAMRESFDSPAAGRWSSAPGLLGKDAFDPVPSRGFEIYGRGGRRLYHPKGEHTYELHNS